jgi:capsular exopolysaccharide synthesis family protein
MADPTPSKELDLTYYLDVVLRRRWIVAAVAIIVFSTTALVTFMARPVYQASALLVIEKERGGAAQSTAMVENSNDDYYQTQYRLLQSRSLLEKVYADLKLADAKDLQSLGQLQNAITIAPILRSRLVNVRVDSYDAALAAAVANRLSEVFVDQNLANQLFISKEVLQALKAREGDSNASDLPAVVNSALIQSFKGQYAKLQTSYAELNSRYTEKHPAVIRVKSSMIALESQIRAETARVVASMKTELSGQLRGNNVRVIDSALVPTGPIKPNKPKNVLLGLVAGLVLGFASALFVEMLDQSVRTQDDVATRLGLPFLGVVPKAVVKAGKIYEALLSQDVSLTSESFRNLRTMVDFAGVGGKAQALLVTSAVQGEGKTHIAANLAITFAQLGESILLIDGDMRRPNVHRVFGLSSERGLSDYLVSGNKAEDAAALIQKSAVPGLSVLACGHRPPNPSELLNTPRLGALISWAREHYDRVIVDCTPMFPINDTLLWGRHIGSAALVCRYGETRVPLILDASQKLKSANLHILGVVINAAKSGGLSYSAYNYYYEQYYQEVPDKPELIKSA